MNTEVTTTETKAMTIGDQMAAVGVNAEDIIIPRLMLMQNTSEFVGDGTAKMGDLVNSQTLEVLGGFDKPVEIMPLKFFKTWRTYDVSGGSPKLSSIDTVTRENERQKPEGIDANGQPFKRYLTFNFLVLLKSEVEAKQSFPMLVMFKSTGLQAGKALATHFVKQSAFGETSFKRTVLIASSKQKKDTNTYATFVSRPGNNVENEDHLYECKKWMSWVSKSSELRVDDMEVGEVVDRTKGVSL